MRPEPVRKSLSGRRRLAKRPPGVQQRGCAFPLPMPCPTHAKKPPECGGFFASMTGPCRRELQPLGAAAPFAAAIAFRTTVAVKAAVAAVKTAAKSAMMPAAAAEAAFHAGQDRKPALLAVVKGLVERIGSVGDLLQRGCRGAHRVGAGARAARPSGE